MGDCAGDDSPDTLLGKQCLHELVPFGIVLVIEPIEGRCHGAGFRLGEYGIRGGISN